MQYQLIQTRTEADIVGVITLYRPQQLNALNDQLMDELGHALKAFDADLAIGCGYWRYGQLQFCRCLPRRLHHP